MGLDPLTTSIGLGLAAIAALALLEEQRKKEEERRRKQEENSRWRREAKERKEEESWRREREREEEREESRRWEREREEEEEDEESRRWEREREKEEIRERRLWEIRRRQNEEDEARRRRNVLSNAISDYNYQMANTSEYYASHQIYNRFDTDRIFSPYGRNYPEEYKSCRCGLCDPEQTPIRSANPCSCSSCQPVNFNPFEIRKNSVKVTFTQTAQNKNQNANNNRSNNQPSTSYSKRSTTSNSSNNTSKQNTNFAPKASGSGSQQPQRNNNNDNKNDHEKDTVKDYGNLNDFIETLKAILDSCKASKELREKVLSFFNKFEKHEESFLRLLGDFRIQNIAIKDILIIVVRLFQSEYFVKDVAFENFIALMEIVAKYIQDELISEIAEDSLRGNKQPFDKQRAECMKKVLQRNNILTEISDIFEKVRKEIVNDNSNQPLEPDFSSIFTKVYHYLKHKVVRGKEWTVTEYFDWIRKLLILLKGLNPEYVELTSVNHSRRQIVFEVYSTVYQGRFRIVVRAYGSRLKICTFFLKERYDKNAKDGDKYVDGEKKP